MTVRPKHYCIEATVDGERQWMVDEDTGQPACMDRLEETRRFADGLRKSGATAIEIWSGYGLVIADTLVERVP